MKELDLQTIRLLQIDILEYVINICKANGLRVSLDAGTLIGAIRHKGYIPWDDDIDITMPRKDYNRLLDLWTDNNSYFALYCPKTVDDYHYPFAKVVDTRTIIIEDNVVGINGYGVYIDIFPQDDLPNDEKRCKSFQRKILKMRNRVSFSVNRNWNLKQLFSHPKYVCKCFVFSKLGWKHSLSRLDSFVQRYNSEDAIYCEELLSTSKPFIKNPKHFFDNLIEVEFEGNRYPAFSEYDKYLKNIYGDYMQLPPVEKRISNHNYKAYFID